MPKKLKKKDFERLRKEKHIKRLRVLIKWLDHIHEQVHSNPNGIMLDDEILREVFPEVDKENGKMHPDLVVNKYHELMREYYRLNITHPTDPATKEDLIEDLNPKNSELIKKTYQHKSINELREFAIAANDKKFSGI